MQPIPHQGSVRRRTQRSPRWQLTSTIPFRGQSGPGHAEALARYRSGQESGGKEYASTVTTFYDLVTDFYEFGWGRSFHFAPAKEGASFEEAIAEHQHYLGEAMGLKPGMNVLDVGCGVGGPLRSIAGRFGVSVVGLNISEYQLRKCAEYNKGAGLGHVCSVVQGDFLEMPLADRSFDAAYHIEAITHSPDKTAAFAEVRRVLRPGGVFAGYDWCMTSLFNRDNPEHRRLKESIERTNAIPELGSFADISDSLEAAGFEVLELRDRASDPDFRIPWYRPLEGSSLSPKRLPRTALGRRLTSATLHVLERLGAVPKGSTEVQNLLNIAADSLVAAGRKRIVTPMYFHLARKPD